MDPDAGAVYALMVIGVFLAYVALLAMGTLLLRGMTMPRDTPETGWVDVCGVVVAYDLPVDPNSRRHVVSEQFQTVHFPDLIRVGQKLPVAMHDTDATGKGLVTNGNLGADMIRVEAGHSFPMHTHPGDHLLIVVRGRGTVTIGGVVHPTAPGDVYMVPGLVEHSVGAVEEHFILSIGSPHKALDAHDRMAVVPEHTHGEDLTAHATGKETIVAS